VKLLSLIEWPNKREKIDYPGKKEKLQDLILKVNTYMLSPEKKIIKRRRFKIGKDKNNATLKMQSF